MHLSGHSLSQLNEAWVRTLDEGLLRGLLLRALEDLWEAHDLLLTRLQRGWNKSP